MAKSRGYTVSLDESTYERLRLYSEITGKSIRTSAIEGLQFWFDTAGAAEILVDTGVDVAPQEPIRVTENVIPIDSRMESPQTVGAACGHC